MKKIVFVITSLQNYGGTERVTTFLANELSNYYEITVLSQQVDKNSQTFTLVPSVNDIRLKPGVINFPLAVKRYIELTSPDLVVVHTMSKLTLALILTGLNTKNLLSLEHTSYLFSSKIYQILRKVLYYKLSKVIVLTESDKLHYVNINKNVDAIYNASPIEIRETPYSIKSKIILSIGQLEPHKGFDLLLEAWKGIEALHPDWVLHIYGKGPEEVKLKDYCKLHNLKSVSFMGLTNSPTDVYDTASIYVMSSRFEGLGLVLIEAQSRGVPTISFDCPYGPSEIINHRKDGILVPAENISELSKAILQLIENDSLREEYSQNALVNAMRFDKKTIIKKWLDTIETEI